MAICFTGYAAAASAVMIYAQYATMPVQTVAVALLATTLGELVLVERIINTKLVSPLARLRNASRQIMNGNLKPNLSNVSPISSSEELSQLGKAFETLVRRVGELDKSLEEARREGERLNEKSTRYISDKERELGQKNAMLLGKAQELEKSIQELSARNHELSQAYEKLQKLDKTKTDFLLIAAHELRTPIQPILGFAKLGEKGVMDRETAWKSIQVEAKKLADMASDILDAGRIESGSLLYKMKPVSVRQVLESATSDSPKLFNGSGAVAIVKDLDSDRQIMADSTRLGQALLNIVGNAVKFAGSMPITIRTRNLDKDGSVEIKVIDSGGGIDPEVLPILFSKFVAKTEANQRGAGLGLYIAKSIIESHGGRVLAENNAELKGATFTVVLPFVRETSASRYAGDVARAGFEMPN